jgi:hypothetical protein
VPSDCLYNLCPKCFSLQEEPIEILQIDLDLHVNYPLDFNETELSETFSKNNHISNLTKIRLEEAQLFHAHGLTDGQT